MVGTGALLAAPPPRLGARAQTAWPGERPIESSCPAHRVEAWTPPRARWRFVQDRLLGARFVAVDRSGVGGQIGYEAAFNAPADGWTPCAVTAPGDAGGAHRVPGTPSSWSPRAQMLADLAAAARDRPGPPSYGSTGVGRR